MKVGILSRHNIVCVYKPLTTGMEYPFSVQLMCVFVLESPSLLYVGSLCCVCVCWYVINPPPFCIIVLCVCVCIYVNPPPFSM